MNYTGFKRGSAILKDGIKYNDLTTEEKDQMEQIWEYEALKKAVNGGGEVGPRDILSNEMFTYIYNNDTIDKVLQDLMENGLKVQSGERIGKTIIFAHRHLHAEQIVSRFNILYPEYGPSFCVVIDNQVNYAQDLINRFEVRDNEPQIAVTVDMLETGIDVPDILNLVFFKPVKSKIKFMQMIGRGTRLSQGIFGDKNKEEFYIFDWCRNFEYFEKNPNGKEAPLTKSLTERLFGLRVEVVFHLQHQKYQNDKFAKQLHDEIKSLLKGQVALLSDNHISVREKWQQVSRFKDDSAWVYVSELDTLALKNDIAPLLVKEMSNENAKKFDVLMLSIQLAMLDEEANANKAIQSVITIASKLQGKATIPQVQAKMDTIKEVVEPLNWENATLEWLEKVRMELRELTQFLLGGDNKWFVIDVEDVISYNGEAKGIQAKVSYKKKVMDFLAENRKLPVLDKIYSMEQLSISDIKELERILWVELGDKSDYDKLTKGMVCGGNVAVFIRSNIGVDIKIAIGKFTDFISQGATDADVEKGVVLNSDQEEFLMTIISYVCENGDITKEVVVNDSPFDEKLPLIDSYMLPLAKYIENILGVVTPISNVAGYA